MVNFNIIIPSISRFEIGFFFLIFHLKCCMYLYLSHTIVHNYTSITPFFLVKNEKYEALAYAVSVYARSENNIISDFFFNSCFRAS